MEIISGEGNDRLNYGWLAVLRWTCSVCCLQEGWLWVRSDREPRAHAGPRLAGTDVPQGWAHQGRNGDPHHPHRPLFVWKGQKTLSFLHWSLWCPWLGREWVERALFALVPSACALVICSYAAVYQTHPCNLIFLYLCVFIFIYNFQFLPFPTYYHNFKTSLQLLFYVDLCPSILNSVGLHLRTDLTTMFHHIPCFFRSLIFLIYLY